MLDNIDKLKESTMRKIADTTASAVFHPFPWLLENKLFQLHSLLDSIVNLEDAQLEIEKNNINLLVQRELEK